MREIFSIRMELSAIRQEPVTRQKLAEEIGVDPNTIRNWETGRTNPPEYLIQYLRKVTLKEKPPLAKAV